MTPEIMDYMILLIPAAFGALLIWLLSVRQRRVDEAFDEAMEAFDEAMDAKTREIDGWMKKMETSVRFVKAGYRCAEGERVLFVGDGYLIVEDHAGQETIEIPPGEKRH